MIEPQNSKPPNYFIADAWLLAQFTGRQWANHFSNLIFDLELTVVVDTYTLIELYNPEWYRLPFIGRTRIASEFLLDHPTIIVNPQELILSEIRSFPEELAELPIATDLTSLHWSVRDYLLKGLFRRDKDLVDLGLDLGEWSRDYEDTKARWPGTVETIIDDASTSGILVKRRNGSVDPEASNKEEFLRYLDRRFLGFEFHSTAPEHELQNLSRRVGELSYGATSQLPAIRLTSLAFWHAYIQLDRSFPMPRRGSDFGDLYRIAFVPYCSYFAVDRAMERVLVRALADLPQELNLLSAATFRWLLEQFAPEPGLLLRY